MKKITSVIIVLCISLAVLVAGAVLEGFSFGDFDMRPLANVFSSIGFLGAVFSGIVLVSLIIIDAARGNSSK